LNQDLNHTKSKDNKDLEEFINSENEYQSNKGKMNSS